jgi:aspartate-semialdehyde dehydrogenase
MRSFNVAVAGALGLVGTTMVRILEEWDFPVNELRLLERRELAGAPVKFRDRVLLTTEADGDSFEGVDIALFATEEDASRLLVPEAVRRGAIAIDNSRAYRLDSTVPLVVPEANVEDLTWQSGIVANPNCTTIGTVVVLKPIHDLSPIRRLVASTYQSTSGGALRGMLELRKQSLDVAAGFPVTPPQAFKYQVAFNLIPFIDVFEGDGYTREEWKLVHETRRILHEPEMRITDTAVRVPTLIGHAVSCNIETADKVTPEQAREALGRAPGVRVVDDVEQLRFPQPIEVAGGDLTHVGRIREDFSIRNGLNLWLVSDNVRKGAAQNAVQIARALIELGHLDRWQAARGMGSGAA